MNIIERTVKNWRDFSEGWDEDQKYDDCHEFFNNMGRGELLELIEELEKIYAKGL